MYGGSFYCQMALILRPVAQKHLKLNYLVYIIANKNNPRTEISNNLSGVKNITQETRKLLQWSARNPLGLNLIIKKKIKNEHLCFLL